MSSSLAIADTDIRYDDGNFVKIKNGIVAMGDADTAIHFKQGSSTLTVVDYGDKSYIAMEKDSIQKEFE